MPQVLNFLNGFTEQFLLRDKGSAVAKAGASAGTDQERIEIAYLAVLSRRPSSRETRLWLADFGADPKQAWADLVWTLVNTQEFRFVR